MNSKRDKDMIHFKQQLNERGCRLTGQRQAVMEVVLSNKGRHMSSEEIFEQVRQSYPGIGLATVYRTLPLLERMNLLSKIYLDDGCIRYELCDPKEQVHHHLICMGCGAVYEVEDDLLGLRDKQILKKTDSAVKTIWLSCMAIV